MSRFLEILLLVFAHPLSWVTGFFARLPGPHFLVQAVIYFYFIRYKKADITEIENPVSSYRSVLDFFTRRLKAGMRPIAPEPYYVVSPADGRISSFGEIVKGKLFQAKGRYFSLAELVGEEKAPLFENGSYYTVYLSPRDYHRVHHACDGSLNEAVYFPGRLLPVNGFSLGHFNGVFSKNKRVALFYEGKTFSHAMIFVGALNVGSIQLSFDKSFWKTARRAPHGRKQKHYPGLQVKKGDEAGIFELGSTAILLFPKKTVKFLPKQPGDAVRMGRPIGRLVR